jgi:hypothetical protein
MECDAGPEPGKPPEDSVSAVDLGLYPNLTPATDAVDRVDRNDEMSLGNVHPEPTVVLRVDDKLKKCAERRKSAKILMGTESDL